MATVVHDMVKHRVLIVDDSSDVRHMVCGFLASDPDIDVVGTAADGWSAVREMVVLEPDLVAMDIDMPVMGGLQALVEIRQRWPQTPVIMFSTLNGHGAATALRALSLGASDYVLKPPFAATAASAEAMRLQLVPRIKALCERARNGMHTSVDPLQSRSNDRASGGAVDIVVMGAGTGGPSALATLLPRFPSTFVPPIAIAHHMPRIFTRLLADNLRAMSHLPVREGATSLPATSGSAWIAPGDHHMTFERRGAGVSIALNMRPAENSCRPSIDVMLRSAVDTYGSGVLAVILTGMGQDGLRGAEIVRQAGGQVIVQDEASSTVWGMAGAVANAGLADAVVPLGSIADEVMRRASRGQTAR